MQPEIRALLEYAWLGSLCISCSLVLHGQIKERALRASSQLPGLFSMMQQHSHKAFRVIFRCLVSWVPFAGALWEEGWLRIFPSIISGSDN